MTEYPAFGKIPRLNREVVITEKIDGTNGLISIERAPSRSTPATTGHVPPRRIFDAQNRIQFTEFWLTSINGVRGQVFFANLDERMLDWRAKGRKVTRIHV